MTTLNRFKTNFLRNGNRHSYAAAIGNRLLNKPDDHLSTMLTSSTRCRKGKECCDRGSTYTHAIKVFKPVFAFFLKILPILNQKSSLAFLVSKNYTFYKFCLRGRKNFDYKRFNVGIASLVRP